MARWIAGAVALTVLLAAALVRAATPSVPSSGSAPAWGETALLQGLAEHFSVPVERLQVLRSQGFGIGELAILHSLAASAGSDMAEGVDKVLQLRASGMGWGEIARQLGIEGAELGRRVAEALQQAAQSAGTRPQGGPGAAARRAAVEQELMRAADAAFAALPEQARAPLAQMMESWKAAKAAGGGPPAPAAHAAGSPSGGPPGKGKPDMDGPPGKGPGGGGGQGKGK